MFYRIFPYVFASLRMKSSASTIIAAKAATAARASAERRMRIVSRVEICLHAESQRGFSDRNGVSDT